MSTLQEDIRAELTEVDHARQPISEMTIHSALNKLCDGRTDEEVKQPECFAEKIAFSFMADYRATNVEWQTYFGPILVFGREDGTTCVWPDISQCTAEMLDYWQGRAGDCSHPILRARYADLVWDLSQVVTGKRAGVEMARMVVDDSLVLVAERLYDSSVDAVEKLRRALSVALSIGDAVGVAAVRDTMIEFERSITEDGYMGLWGVCYDELMRNGKVTLETDQEAWIVSSLEERLGRCVVESSAQRPNPHVAEQAAIRLAQYYRGKGNPRK